MTLRACATCGDLTEHTYCTDHAPRDQRVKHRTDTSAATWKNLSIKARRLQPFCLLCGRTANLQADHSPRAWARREAGLPIRLADVTVLCGPCNSGAGSSKPDSQRFTDWQQMDGDLHALTPDCTLPDPQGDGGTRTAITPSGKAQFESETPGGYR